MADITDKSTEAEETPTKRRAATPPFETPKETAAAPAEADVASESAAAETDGNDTDPLEWTEENPKPQRLARKGTMMATVEDAESFLAQPMALRRTITRGPNCSMLTRFKASMILSAVGDAMGFRNGEWEFNYSGASIHANLEKMGGLENLDLKRWKVSDDTAMHLATAEALMEGADTERAELALFERLCRHYIASFKDMIGRAPGPTTASAVRLMERDGWDAVRYARSGGGCGGSMRSMCIGLRYYGEANRPDLIAASIESGRLTHNHPTGFFGALCSALFTAYAIEDIPAVEWGRRMLDEVMPKAYEYLQNDTVRTNEWEPYQQDLKYFEEAFDTYLKLRGIRDAEATEIKWPKHYGVKERDAYYNSISFAGWGGASGHDSVIIAYDALLAAGDSWSRFCMHGVLHGGDNDSTGAIGAAWWGAIYGLDGVPSNHYSHVEYYARAAACGDALWRLAGKPE